MSQAQTIPVITLDGPSGVGKGTVSQRLAQLLGWHILDSGALYRVVGLAALRRGIDFDDHVELAALARHLPLEFQAVEQVIRILLDAEDITDAVRTEEAGNNASKVAAIPAVRHALLARQHDFRQAPGLIADGRDMGTVVFPRAPLKIFLTASPEERAKRRHKQLKEKGIDVNISDLVKALGERDLRDSARAIAPLKPAIDAVCIDTSDLGIHQVVDKILHCWHSQQVGYMSG